MRVFLLAPHPHFPEKIPVCFSHISSKNSSFKKPIPLGISNDLPRNGYGFFSGTNRINQYLYKKVETNFIYSTFKKLSAAKTEQKTKRKGNIGS